MLHASQLFQLGYTWSMIMLQTCINMLKTVAQWKVHKTFCKLYVQIAVHIFVNHLYSPTVNK